MNLLKKSKKIKGFTLIELLAVIVVLIIIMLIVVPSVLNILSDARKKAFETTVKGLVSTTENECMAGKVKNEDVNRDIVFSDYEMLGETLSFKGKAPKDGRIRVNENCEVAVALKDDEYCVQKGYNNKTVRIANLDEYGNCALTEYISDSQMCSPLEGALNVLLEDGFIPVATADELNNIRYDADNVFGVDTPYEGTYRGGLDKDYVQVADIDLSPYTNWQPLGHDWSNIFTGNYDGGGHVITNLTQNLTGTTYEYEWGNYGLFGIIEHYEPSFIRNLGIVDAHVEGTEGGAGILSGYYESYVENSFIENVFVTGIIQVDNDYNDVAGLVSYTSASLKNIYVSVEVSNLQIIDDEWINSVVVCHYYPNFSGCDYGVVENTYFNKDIADFPDYNGIEGRTTAEMTNPHNSNTYRGWDFNTIWAIDGEANNGYPYLKNKNVLGIDQYEELKNDCTYEISYNHVEGTCTESNTIHGVTANATSCEREGYYVSNFSLESGICGSGFDNKTGQCNNIQSSLVVGLNWSPNPIWTFEIETATDGENFGLGFAKPNLIVHWGDGSNEELFGDADEYVEHTYATAGIYEVTLEGFANQISFCHLKSLSCHALTTPEKLYDIKTKIPSDMGLISAEHMFSNTEITSFTEQAFFDDISGKIRSILGMFAMSPFNGDINSWDTSNIFSTRYMFLSNSSFNQDLNNWDTSKFTDIGGMFMGASSFNGDISNWNTMRVKDMSQLFSHARAFNGNISNWNTSSVTRMEDTFSHADIFNTDIGNWDTSKVTTMRTMFYNAENFNQDLNDWDTSKVTSMRLTFSGADFFNGNISNWNTSNVLDMISMFNGANAFNQNIGGWDTSQVTTMRTMFQQANAFNQDIGSWDTSNVLDMAYMFNNAHVFNGNISNWNTSKVTTMRTMFQQANAFNRNISGWNTANVTDMAYMFHTANTFNQNLSGWCVSNIPSKQTGFDSNTTAWLKTNRQPIWGTCP